MAYKCLRNLIYNTFGGGGYGDTEDDAKKAAREVVQGGIEQFLRSIECPEKCRKATLYYATNPDDEPKIVKCREAKTDKEKENGKHICIAASELLGELYCWPPEEAEESEKRVEKMEWEALRSIKEEWDEANSSKEDE